MKRFRKPVAKPGQLLARYGRVDRNDRPDIVYAWGGHGASSPDGRLLCRAFEDIKVLDDKTLAEELVARGYDLETLKFSIEQKR